MENINKKIDEITAKLNQNYSEQKYFDIGIGERLPDRAMIISIVDDLRKLTFPGFFASENMAYISKENYAGYMLAVIYEKLYRQICVALSYENQWQTSEDIEEKAKVHVLNFFERIPAIQSMILKDVEAELAGDPAAMSEEEVILSYPGLYAIFVYRYAHELYLAGIPFIPRIMSEHAHGKTGIDINPGATIGEYFFIDHGTGIVIGETTTIGNHVKIYQGVTLGALSLRKGQALSGVKRHPTIEDNVVIYANTTILGGETVIGANSVVAGNTFITESIPANSKVQMTQLALNVKEDKRNV